MGRAVRFLVGLIGGQPAGFFISHGPYVLLRATSGLPGPLRATHGHLPRVVARRRRGKTAWGNVGLFGLFMYVMGAVLLPHAFFITRATKSAWGVFVVGERIRPCVCVFPLHGAWCPGRMFEGASAAAGHL